MTRARLEAAALGLFLVGALWAWTFRAFGDASKRKTCRFDFGESVAYPVSDAGCDYQNALAILTGDGWVNWRETNRWSVYKPGWAAFLALLAGMTRADPERMQALITLLLAAIPAALFVTVRTLYRGRWATLAAFLAALALLYFPATGSWWFVRCMMSEGPTLLLLLAFCCLAIRTATRSTWRWQEGLACGGVAGALAMVRSQSRYSVAAVALVLVVAAWRRRRTRLPVLGMALLGYLAVTGPYLVKSSLHLGQAFFGTSVLDLRAVLAWSPAGKSIGGENLDPRAFASEGEALDEMSRRTREAIFAYRVPLPDRLATGLTMFTDYSLSVPARLAGREVSEPWFRAAAFAFALAGMALAGARFGVVALVPLAAGLGYVAPLVAIDFYLPRFGEPISWIGLVYIAGVLAILIDRGARRRALRAARVRLRGAARLGRRRERGDEPVSSRRARRSPAPWRTGALALLAWMVVATCALLAFDRRPLPRPSAAALLADPRVANLLRDAGIERGGELEREIERAVASRAGSTRVLVGVAHLPTVVPPGGPRLRNIWFRFRPASETYTALLLAAPWKGPSGRFELRLLTLPGELYSDFRNGDEVVAIVDETGASAFAAHVDFAPTLRLRTIFPTRWADP